MVDFSGAKTIIIFTYDTARFRSIFVSITGMMSKVAQLDPHFLLINQENIAALLPLFTLKYS